MRKIAIYLMVLMISFLAGTALLIVDDTCGGTYAYNERLTDAAKAVSEFTAG